MAIKRSRRILHIITGLEDGGAEAVLYRLVTNDTENDHHVISLSTRGKYADLLEQADIHVEALGMRAGRPSPIHLARLIRMIKKQRPDVVQTWMYHADFIGGIAARLAGVKRVFWGLRNGTLDPQTSSKNTIAISRMNAYLSHIIPTEIVSCSESAAELHKALGYAPGKFRVIPNGYNLSEYLSDDTQRSAIRQAFAIEDGTPVLGMVARFDPQKDHRTLLFALTLLKGQLTPFRFLLVGSGLTNDNQKLRKTIDELGLQDEVALLGRRNDIPAIMNALDIHVLSSAYGEAFPNVICEAMACGTPCVSTDIGDAAFIMGETGWLVPPQTPESLTHAMKKAIGELKFSPEKFRSRKQEARNRISENFGIGEMVQGYWKVWTGAAVRCRPQIED